MMLLRDIIERNCEKDFEKIKLDYDGDVQEYETIEELEEEAYNWGIEEEPATYTVVKNRMYIKMNYDY